MKITKITEGYTVARNELEIHSLTSHLKRLLDVAFGNGQDILLKVEGSKVTLLFVRTEE